MKKALSLREMLDNFRGVLIASYPFLTRAGIEPGDDEWDEFQESAFELLVSTSPGNGDWRYATWNVEAPIAVTVTGEIWVGEPNENSDGIVDVRYEKRALSGPLNFGFREFQHPVMDDPIKAMEFVLGEVVSSSTELPRGTLVCAPFESSEFE